MKLRNLTNEELRALARESGMWAVTLLPVLIGATVARTTIDTGAVSRYIEFDLDVMAELVRRGLARQEDLDQGQEALRRFREETL